VGKEVGSELTLLRFHTLGAVNLMIGDRDQQDDKENDRFMHGSLRYTELLV
jgi:hypothetical protein